MKATDKRKRTTCYPVLILIILFSLHLLYPGAAWGLDQEFQNKLANLTWIAYGPTHSDPVKKIIPSEASVREDLIILRAAGFNGLITYSCKEPDYIHRIAREVGFKGIIAGMWDPQDPEEIRQAVLQKDYIDGYCVGNEGLMFNRYTLEQLAGDLDKVRKTTGKAVSTSELTGAYKTYPQLGELCDWIFPNIHPYWTGRRDPLDCAAFALDQYQKLGKLVDKPILVKETGLPTDGDSECSAEQQLTFYRQMAGSGMHFAYFEAFDQEWKNNDAPEPYWGLFNSQREPKPAARWLIEAHSSKLVYHAHFTIGNKEYQNRSEDILMDAAPFVENNHTYVPLYWLAQALGADAEQIVWDSALKSARVEGGAMQATFTDDSQRVELQHETVNMECKVVSRNNRLFVPLDQAAHIWGLDVATEGDSCCIYLGQEL
ncbi:MAG: stalk domain-containing protein [Syntrophomonas sp.]